ncbi:putative ribonuclease H-like domain-containing protein [Tanacetum coccineum]
MNQLANLKQTEDLDLLHEDLEQIDDVDIEEMDINWQIAMIAIRMKKFYKKTGRRVRVDGKTPVGFDKKKLECFNCHNTGHFARECTAKGTHDGKKKRDSFYQHQEAGKQEKNQMGLLTMDDGIVNWGEHTEAEETNHALMAISSSNEVTLCSKTCIDSYNTLKTLCDEQMNQLGDQEAQILAYSQAVKKLEAQLVTFQKQQLSLNEKLTFQANEIYEKDEKLKRYRRIGMKAVKEKKQLQKTLDSWKDSSKNLWRLIASGMSSNSKVGLGFEIQSNNEVLSYEEEMNFSVFKCSKEDSIGKPVYSRFTKTNDFKGVPHPLSGDYTPKPQEEIDDSFEGSCGNTSEHSFETESKSLSVQNEMSKSRLEVTNEKVVSELQEVEPSCAKQVKTPRKPLKDKETQKVNRKNWNDMMERELGEGYSFTKKKCFVCGSLSHLIKDCDYYEKKMAREAEVKRVVNTGNWMEKPVWTKANRVNHSNKFVPRSVQLNAGRPNFNSVRPNINTGRTNINSVRPKVNAVSSNVNTVRSRQPMPDENQILLKVPRHHNMYSFDMKTPTPAKGFACLIAKATSDESKLWHRRLGHINFKNLNKLVKGNLSESTSEKTNNAGTSQTLKCIASEEKDEEVELIVVPSAVTIPEEIVDSRTSSTKSKKEKILTDPQQEEKVSSTDTLEDNPKIQAFRRELEQIALKHLGTVPENNSTSTPSVNTGSQTVNTGRLDHDDSPMPELEIFHKSETGIFDEASYDEEGVITDFNSLPTEIEVSPTPTLRIHNIHPKSQILGDPKSAVQTRSKVQTKSGAHALLSHIQKQQRNNHKDQQHCLFAYFLSQEEPKKIAEALQDDSWVQAMQEELLQFKLQQVWVLVDLPHGMKVIGTKWVYRNKRDERGVVVRNKARLVAQGYTQEEAPRAWYATLSTFLEKHGYKRGTIDKTLFIKRDKKDIMLVQVYVDDIIFGSTNKSWCDEFEALMKSRFQMSSMGELTFFLGLQVKQNKGGIFISQDKYVAEILKKFDLVNVKAAITPMETKVTPKTSHLNAVKRIFKYLKGKPNLGLWYPRESPFDLEAFSDSDYGGSNLDRKSTTGGCQFLGQRLISWQCKKQTIVATSTTEAEYVLTANCCGQYCDKHNQVGFLRKPDESAGFAEIVDFLRGSNLRYALTSNPPIYDSLVKQFWQTATTNTIADGTLEIHATIDTKGYTITEASIRDSLQLADATGITMLPNDEIFEGMGQMGYPTDGTFTFWKSFFTPQWRYLVHHLLHCISSKSGGWDQFGSNIATALICLSTDRVYNFSKLIFDGMVANLKSKTKFLMYPRFLQLILNIQTENKHLYLAVTLTKKIFGNMKRGFRGAPRPLLPAMLLVATTNPNAGQEHHAVTQTQPSSSTLPVPSTSSPPVQSPPPIPASIPSPTPIPASIPSPTPIPASIPTPTPIPETEPEPFEHTFEEPSPVHQHFSPPQEQAHGQMTMDDLLQVVPQLISRIDSLETDLKQTKLTMGNALVKLVKKVKKLEGFLKRRNVVLSDSEEEEPEAQGRKSQDDPLASLVQGLVTPSMTKVNASGEEQVEDISPNTLEAAKTLSRVASLKPKSIDKGRRYKRRKETKGKKVVSSLDFQEEVDTGAKEVNTAEGVNTGSIKISTVSEQVSTGSAKRSIPSPDKGQRAGKAPMIIEETPKKKEQISPQRKLALLKQSD